MIELRKITQLQWRKFIDSESGKEGLLWLHEQSPYIGKGQQHEIIFDAGFSQGYAKCLEKLTEILAVEPKREIDASND